METQLDPYQILLINDTKHPREQIERNKIGVTIFWFFNGKPMKKTPEGPSWQPRVVHGNIFKMHRRDHSKERVKQIQFLI
jgi:hypothetical protein